jgi:hypothetical protein
LRWRHGSSFVGGAGTLPSAAWELAGGGAETVGSGGETVPRQRGAPSDGDAVLVVLLGLLRRVEKKAVLLYFFLLQ